MPPSTSARMVPIQPKYPEIIEFPDTLGVEDHLPMAERLPSNEKETSYVTFEGRTIVDVNELVRSPKVQEALEKISSVHAKLKRKKGVIILRRPAESQ